MTQLSPTTMLYSQAVALLEEFKKDSAAGKLKTPEEISQGIRDVLNKFTLGIGRPLLRYEPYEVGEPASSEKINRFTKNLQHDVNILQDQVDVLRAASIFLHNYITTEILKLQRENAQASNKVKTLQLYSNSSDLNLILFGDQFINDEFFDYDFIPEEQKPDLSSPGYLRLGRETQSFNVIESAAVKVLPSSNGFLGNNQEILDPSLAITNPATNEKQYTFIAEQDRRATISHIIDGEPNTWIEYENYLVDYNDKVKARNYNFSYLQTDTTNQGTQQKASWADGPANEILKLDIEFDLGATKSINNISYTPFGLRNNINHPVKVSSVQVSEDGTDWTIVNPQNIWVGTDANLQSAQAAEQVTIGTAIWTFEETPVRYIRMYIQQPRSVQCNIGHLYYETPVTSGNTSPERVEGPIPPLSDPAKFYTASNSVQNNLIQKREFFVGRRWAIGVRDCLIEEVKYKETSVMVSERFRINGVIDRVALESDIFIPESFDNDQLWVRFYISPNEGVNWYPISRIQDDNFGIPEIIAFNDPLPSEFHEPGVTYYTVSGTVNSLRLKVELSRPTDAGSSSPIVRSYKLKVRKR